MPRPRSKKIDPFELAIEAALEPGRSVGWRQVSTFVGGLRPLAENLAELVGSDPGRAAALHETFIAGCFEKANEVHDDGGSFGEFVRDLFAGWVTARQASGAGADETVRRLLAWTDDDPYCLAYDLERHVAHALDRRGAAEFERAVRARLAGTAPEASGAERDPAVRKRRWGAVLRTFFSERKNIGGAISVAEETGVTNADCAVIARLLAARRKAGAALEWVERGIALEDRYSGHELERMKRELLQKLGRGGEALELAWEQYRKSPHLFYLEELMRFVPKGERAAWREKALVAAENADFGAAIEIFLEAKETERLVARVRRAKDADVEHASASAVAAAAEKLAAQHPDLAARLHRALGLEILKAKRSKHYDEALSHFDAARKAYEKAGLAAEWTKLVARIRSDHRQKYGFMPGFEAVVRGFAPDARPSFLERAKARWPGSS